MAATDGNYYIKNILKTFFRDLVDNFFLNNLSRIFLSERFFKFWIYKWSVGK